MIERFNFYDIYGYLIPGAAWLALLALPVYLTHPSWTLSVAALTSVGLGGGYLAGHYLSGLARTWLPSQKLSEKVLDDSDPTLAADVKGVCREYLLNRFRLDWSQPDAKKEVFYLFRTALAQAKVGSYVEQYQGIATMCRSLAAAALLTICYYVAWVAGSVFQLPRPSGWTDQPLVVVGLAGIIPVWLARRLPFAYAEGVAFCAVLTLAGLAGGELHELTRRQMYELAFAVAILSLAYQRLKGSSQYFTEIMVASVCRDVVVLATTKTKIQSTKPPNTPPDPSMSA
jgi:hypothetical protein